MPDPVVYIDGQWLPFAAAKVSVFDHGLLYGDGVFEGIRAYDGHVFRLGEHLRRLARSAEKISLKIPVEPVALAAVVEEAVSRNGLRDAYIRLLVTRGVGDLGLDPRACPTPSVVVIADKLALFPERCYRDGLEVIIAKTRRNIVEAIDPTIKSMNYLNNILAKIEAVQAGVPEAIMLNAQGYVAECTGDNVFVVKRNAILTPPTSAGALEGITRSAVMDIVRDRTPYAVEEALFTSDDLFTADEIFFTGTAAEVIPVTKIDGRPVGTGKPGNITAELVKLFQEFVRAEAKNGQSIRKR